MSDRIEFTIDGKDCVGKEGQTIIQAADENGVYIPRLCFHQELKPSGSCRICTVSVNGRYMAACTTPVAEGMMVLNETPELLDMRQALVEMLFVEGNHFCPSCERSGNCELQALAYRLQIMAPRFPFMFPRRTLDASHPQIFIDGDRCIQCGRCVRAAQELDKKHILGFIGRSGSVRVKASSSTGLQGVDIKPDDHCVSVCPVGAILVKGVAYRTPIGKRRFDKTPIGADIEAKA
ncbi:MAG: 2Fe-2S iron-sulfur cluster-binding protein [Gemmatimonadota bacterium]|nr:2Fe-2S iron-sulfur cluster-binding protein [Gemmatimonadota bacterium]